MVEHYKPADPDAGSCIDHIEDTPPPPVRSIAFYVPCLAGDLVPDATHITRLLTALRNVDVTARAYTGRCMVQDPGKDRTVHASMLAVLIDVAGVHTEKVNIATATIRIYLYHRTFDACRSVFALPEYAIINNASGIVSSLSVGAMEEMNVEEQRRAYDEGTSPITELSMYRLVKPGDGADVMHVERRVFTPSMTTARLAEVTAAYYAKFQSDPKLNAQQELQ